MEPIGKERVLTPSKSFCLLTTLLIMSLIMEISASPEATVYVHPSSSTVSPGQTFAIDIRISDVYDLYGWEFNLTWNSNLLDVIDVTEGPFLKQGGETFFTYQKNNSAGYILVDCTLLGNVPGVNGSGTLAYVKFYAEKEGSTVLDLHDTILINSLEQEIPHTTNDGNVTISQPVGGIRIPVDKFCLLAPWIGIGLTVVLALAAVTFFVKYRRKKVRLVHDEESVVAQVFMLSRVFFSACEYAL